MADGPAADPTLATASVLLVEDSDDDALFIRKDLEDGIEYAFVDDIEVTRVASLAAAVEACEAESFDAVFLDLGLPDSNGIETVSRFTDHGFDVPVVVLTGLRDRGMALEAIREGAQDYLVKGDTTPESVVRSMRHGIERKKNERQLRRQRDQMEFFNSILQHDLLNGMEIIQGYARMLESDLEGEQRERAATVVDWSDNIVELTGKVRDVLDTLTSEETADLRPVFVDGLLPDLAAETEALREGATVTTDCPADVAVLADELFADVLRNLMTNAVVHTRPDPVAVTVTVDPGEERVRIAVADDGPGVPDAAKEEIFQRGEKGNASGGSGFGLYFVASMVDTYGGSVHVEDADAGGARFVVELPRASRRRD